MFVNAMLLTLTLANFLALCIALYKEDTKK